MKRSLDESLSRLGLDSLPLYQLHDPYGLTVAEAMGPGGAVPALIDLRDQGVIGAIGIASGTLAQVREYVDTGAFDVVLSHNRYTLATRTAGPLFEAAHALGMTVLNAAPFGGGTLANGDGSFGYRPMPADFAAHVERVRGLADLHGVDLAAAALHFSLRSPLVDATVVGITSTARLDALGPLIDADVPDAFFDAVESLGTPPPGVED
ncbi:hypothetical protein AYL44_07435 [Microbacterium oleivorans]|uniref:NADP-dependent oxidoreductase domain-containing protein n=1 Tax=Microbacterium oleivorans TaxID=273677 RepID=A0A177KA44_9MICO|nr:hypothetical protein AYL44_07435 [Microbacterium oleivorans]